MVLLQQAVAYIFFQKNAEYYPFSHFVFDIILLVFLFLSYASWWRNESTNQEVKWGKFCSGKVKKEQCIFLERGEKISHLSDVMTTIPEYISPIRLIDKKIVTGKQTVERDDLDNEANQALGATFTKETGQSVDFRSGAFQLLKGKHLSAKGQIMIHESLARKNKLSVGDKLTLSNFQMTESGAKEMTFDIVGIFSGKKEETFTGMEFK